MFKFGVASHAQLSVFSISALSGGGSLAVGMKWRLLDDNPLLGRFAILPSVKVTGTKNVGLLLISSHDLGPVALDINAGYTRTSSDGSAVPRDATVWTISTGGPGVGPVGWVAEVFGYPRTTGPAGQPSTVAALFGPTLAACSWLAFDAGLIEPLSGSPPRAFYLGGVWNVGKLF